MPATASPFFRAAAASGLRVSLVDPAGNIRAIANCEAVLLGGHAAVMGHGWEEFIEPEEVPRLLAWFAEPVDTGPIVFCGQASHAGAPVNVRFALVKAWVVSSGLWLVVGSFEPIGRPVESAAPFAS